MTKSGGFSIKKRHRKLGALIGLAALAVPFAANLGTLGDAIHAVTGPQNVYESKLLNVKLETSQDKAKTTWDLEFDRSDMSVSEQTVKFKLDLEKAGLTDAEITQDGKAIDMREGIVDAVLKTQATHLILTAISSNEDKHDITLPVTELGLYNEENGENLLPADNRSVDLTMAFEQVAEIAKESSSSETVTEAVAKEEKQSEEKSEKKAVRNSQSINPTDDGANGFKNSPFTTTATGTQDANKFSLPNDVFAGTSAGTSNDNIAKGFQLYFKGGANSGNVVYYDNFTGAGPTSTGDINIRKKYNAQTGSIEINQYGDAGTASYDYARTHYHKQYETGTGQSSFMVEFHNQNQATGSEFSVFYDQVGKYYAPGDTDGQTMAAVLTVSNIQLGDASMEPFGAVDNYGGSNHGGMPHFIDVPNNMFSGIFYRGIRALDVDFKFYVRNSDGSLGKQISLAQNSNAQMGFYSLNNFGHQGASQTQEQNNYTGQNLYDWTETETNIGNGLKAERVAKLSTSDAASDDVQVSSTTVMTGVMTTYDGKSVRYSTGHGNYLPGANPQTGNFQDALHTATYNNGGVSYLVSGTDLEFRLYTGDYNTWQTFTASGVSPQELVAPKKMVSSSTDPSTVRNNEITTVLTDDGQKTLHGNLDEKDLELALDLDDSLTKTDDDGKVHTYYSHYYFIDQETYAVTSENPAKPDTIVMTDLLPEGVTLYHDTQLAGSDITLYDTSNKEVSRLDSNDNANYTYEVTTDQATGRQKVTVTITAFGVSAIAFNGNNIDWRLHVKVEADKAQKSGKEEKFDNFATVVEDNYDSQDTNHVVTYENPHNGVVQFSKVDDLDNALTGADFKLEIEDPDNAGIWTDVTTIEGTVVQKSQEGSITTFTNLGTGNYRWSETTTPLGYYNNAEGPFEFELTVEEINSANVMVMTVTGADTPKPTGTPISLNPNKYVADNGNNFTFKVTNPQDFIQLQVQKLDEAGKALSGAAFTIKEYEKTGALALPLSVQQDDGSMFLTSDATTLRYNTVYEIRESETPSGYSGLEGALYIKFVPSTDSNGKLVVNMQTLTLGSDGKFTVTKTTETKSIGTDAAPKYLGAFTVDNYAKSIFPRVGGTGIQAYIGAGLIVMLIAGGAAWYIKRRQNQ